MHSSVSSERRGQEEGEVERERERLAAIYLMPYPDRGLTSVR